jgi:hypothetical protein
MTDKAQPQGINRAKVTPADDVEGHRFASRTTEPDGISRSRVTGDDDVEGHRFAARTTEPDGVVRSRVTGDDDVEGHSLVNPFLNRELSRARERDVEQHLKAREFEQRAKEAKKDHR